MEKESLIKLFYELFNDTSLIPEKNDDEVSLNEQAEVKEQKNV